MTVTAYALVFVFNVCTCMYMNTKISISTEFQLCTCSWVEPCSTRHLSYLPNYQSISPASNLCQRDLKKSTLTAQVWICVKKRKFKTSLCYKRTSRENPVG